MKNYLIFIFALLCFSINTVNAADEAPIDIKGVETIGTERARVLLEQGLPFIDVRSLKDFNAGHLPGAHHLAIHGEDFTVENLMAIADKEAALVFYCNGITCMGSSLASQKAVEWGWTRVIYYREGFRHWQAEGRSIETD